MICKYLNKKIDIGLMAVGVVTLIFGLIFGKVAPKEAHNLSMISGMFAGFGGAIAAAGLISIMKRKISSPEELRKSQIKRTDERNIQITGAASTAAYVGAMILFAVMAFLFVGMGNFIAGFISIGAMYINLLVFIVAYRTVSTKI